MSNVHDIEKEINRVKDQLAQIHEPTISSEDDQETEPEPEELIQEQEQEQPEDQPEEEQQQTVSKKKKKKKKNKKKILSESESESSETDDEEIKIDFVVKRISDSLNFYTKTVYRMISKYRDYIFDEDELNNLHELYLDELEDFHKSYEHSLNLLPNDVDIPDKIYQKFQKNLNKVEKKWNTFISKLEIVK